MTDEQINQRIAEACGWEDITESVAPEEFRRRATGMLRDKHGHRTPLKQIPNYCTDLNAMHEAEKVLMHADLLFEYGMHISMDHKYDYLLRATAWERAEAFLRTLGKWDDQSGERTEMVKEVQK